MRARQPGREGGPLAPVRVVALVEAAQALGHLRGRRAAGRSTPPRSAAPRRAAGRSRAPRPPCRSGSRAGGSAAISCASSRARSRQVPRGTTSLTSPIRCASRASITRPGDDQLHRLAEADDPRQALGAAVAEADVPAPAGDAERRVLVGDAQVRPAGPLEAAGVGDAVDGRDRRLGQVGPARRAEDAGPLAAGVGCALLRRVGHDQLAREGRLEVAAGAERVLAGAGEDPDERLVVVAEAASTRRPAPPPCGARPRSSAPAGRS